MAGNQQSRVDMFTPTQGQLESVGLTLEAWQQARQLQQLQRSSFSDPTAVWGSVSAAGTTDAAPTQPAFSSLPETASPAALATVRHSTLNTTTTATSTAQPFLSPTPPQGGRRTRKHTATSPKEGQLRRFKKTDLDYMNAKIKEYPYSVTRYATFQLNYNQELAEFDDPKTIICYIQRSKTDQPSSHRLWKDSNDDVKKLLV